VSIEELIAALDELEAAIGKVRSALAGDLAPLPPLRRGVIRPENVLDLVVTLYGVTRDELAGPSRRRDVMGPRHAAMLVLHDHLGYSYSTIGQLLGRNHSTVLAAVGSARKWDRSRISPLLMALRDEYQT
jgi:chromosomal replication initiation ATPase DnaA